jgi:hypothetical protein
MKKIGKIDDSFKIGMKSLLWSSYFLINIFLVILVLKNSILGKKFILFFLLLFLVWEKRKKVTEFKLKRGKIIGWYQFRLKKGWFYCQLVSFNEKSCIKVFFGLSIIWEGRCKLIMFLNLVEFEFLDWF